MAPTKNFQSIDDNLRNARDLLIKQYRGQLGQNPALMDIINKQVDDMRNMLVAGQETQKMPPDGGFSQFIGLTPESDSEFDDSDIPIRVDNYEEDVALARIKAVANLYYIYQHEKLGVFKVMEKLKDLFEAGTLRLSTGSGAYRLYQFDKREVLRYTIRDRYAAYRRVLGYSSAPVPTGATPNRQFHELFTAFINEVTQYWRDKRISDVIRERADDPSFGSIAAVRRACLDLRNNLKWASYGNVSVLSAEVMILLKEAFNILKTEDIQKQFGAENAWDVVEEVLVRYFGHTQLQTSPRQRMAVAGRDIIKWTADSILLVDNRPTFETGLDGIAIQAEEWLTSAESLGLARRKASSREIGWEQKPRPGLNTPGPRRVITPTRTRYTEWEAGISG
jgi:hypothetical protein